WPLAEALKNEAGVVDDDTAGEARAKLAAVVGCAGEDVEARVATMIGLGDEPFPVEELFWGLRRLFEVRARERPVVLVIQDIHLGEPTLLELLQQLVTTIDDAPVLVVCTARPDLEDRGLWEETDRGTTLLLPQLDGEASKAMVESLLGGGTLH